MSTSARRAAIYLRISVAKAKDDPDADSYSIEDQQARCEALARAEGLTVTETYVDDGISAYVKGSNRPGWGKLRQAVTAGDFDVLIFDRQDRLARDQFETMSFIIDCGRGGIAWHSVQEGKTDLADPMQVMFAVFRGGDAQGYSAKISANRKAANAARRAQGQPIVRGRAFGYEDDNLTLRESEAELIRQGVADVLDGKTLGEVWREWRVSEVKPPRSNAWNRLSVRNLLCRWRNAGVVEYEGEPTDYVAQWQPILSRSDLEDVREILLRGGGTQRSVNTLLSGLVQCACGEGLASSGQGSYTCVAVANGRADKTKSHSAVSRRILEPLVIDAVCVAHLIPQSQPGTDARKLADLSRDLRTCREAQERISEAYEEGLYTKAVMTRRMQAQREREAALTAQIDGIRRANASAEMNAVAIDLLAGHSTVGFDMGEAKKLIRARFDGLSFEDKRKVIAATVSVQVEPGRGTDRIAIDPKWIDRVAFNAALNQGLDRVRMASE